MKQLLSLFLAAALSLSLVSCGSTNPPAGSQGGASAGSQTQQPAPGSRTLSMGTASLGGNFFTMGAAAAAVFVLVIILAAGGIFAGSFGMESFGVVYLIPVAAGAVGGVFGANMGS